MQNGRVLFLVNVLNDCLNEKLNAGCPAIILFGSYPIFPTFLPNANIFLICLF